MGALGKAFYKGGFEPKMNRREAALILQLQYVLDVHALDAKEILTNKAVIESAASQRKRFAKTIEIS